MVAACKEQQLPVEGLLNENTGSIQATSVGATHSGLIYSAISRQERKLAPIGSKNTNHGEASGPLIGKELVPTVSTRSAACPSNCPIDSPNVSKLTIYKAYGEISSGLSYP